MIYQPKLPPDTYVRKFNHDTALYVFFAASWSRSRRQSASTTETTRRAHEPKHRTIRWRCSEMSKHTPCFLISVLRMYVRKFVWCSRLEASLLRSWRRHRPGHHPKAILDQTSRGSKPRQYKPSSYGDSSGATGSHTDRPRPITTTLPSSRQRLTKLPGGGQSCAGAPAVQRRQC